jgi:hypothetical protein
MASRPKKKNKASPSDQDLRGFSWWVNKKGDLMYKKGKKSITVGSVSFVTAMQHDASDPMHLAFKCMPGHLTRLVELECLITSERDCSNVLVQANPDTLDSAISIASTPPLPYHILTN